MRHISITELKAHIGKYLALADTEDIYVTKNGKPLAKLTTARIDKLAAAESLFDILPSHVELDHAREERLR